MLKSSPDSIMKACQQYTALCESGQIKRPDFWHFCGWFGEVADDVSKFIKSDGAVGCGFDPAADAEQRNETMKKQDSSKNRAAADALRRLYTIRYLLVFKGEFQMKEISDRPYRIKVTCRKSLVEELVFFYEVEHDGEIYARFNGCDHQWNAGDEACKLCHADAYQKLITGCAE